MDEIREDPGPTVSPDTRHPHTRNRTAPWIRASPPGLAGVTPWTVAVRQVRGSFAVAVLAMVVGTVAGRPLGVSAQLPEVPTLQELGVEYVSEAGFTQILLSGQLDVEGFYVSNSWQPTTVEPDRCDACHIDVARELRQGDGGNHLERLRLFADIFVGDHVYALVELRGDRGRERFDADLRGRLEQVFLRLTTGSGREGIQVGRFASPFGSYADRHLGVLDPFVRPPLAYDYRTVMNRWRWPGSEAGFLTWKDQPEDIDIPGAPPVWDVPYQWGGMAFGRLGSVDVRAAAMNSAPSSHPNAWDFSSESLRRPSLVLAARWAVRPGIELGASYDRGPWLALNDPAVTVTPPNGPAGPAPADRQAFDQEMVSLDLSVARGPMMLRAEVIRDRWEVPNLEATPASISASVEVQTDLVAGVFIAARAGAIDFRAIDDGAAGREDWDYDVQRYEGSLGYRISRRVGLLASVYRQRQSVLEEGDTDFAGVRMWWLF